MCLKINAGVELALFGRHEPRYRRDAHELGLLPLALPLHRIRREPPAGIRHGHTLLPFSSPPQGIRTLLQRLITFCLLSFLCCSFPLVSFLFNSRIDIVLSFIFLNAKFISQKEGEKLEDISPILLNECAQLVKANSIEGSKLSTCHVIYVSMASFPQQKGGHFVFV